MTALAGALARFAGSNPVLLMPEQDDDMALVASPAESVTSAALDRLARLGGGMVLLALDGEIAGRLELADAALSPRHRTPMSFLDPIDAAPVPGARWSAADPAHTMRVAAAPESGPDDLAVPGRVQPVRSTRQRLLAGEPVAAALELAFRAGCREAVALCAALRPDAVPGGVPRVRAAELRAKVEAERAGALAVSCRLPTAFGQFRAVAQAGSAGGAMVALVHGAPGRVPARSSRSTAHASPGTRSAPCCATAAAGSNGRSWTSWPTAPAW